jgi:hypothetical protein
MEGMRKALGSLAVLNVNDRTVPADEETRKALGPLARRGDCTCTATTETQKALGPLAVARLRETGGLPRLTGGGAARDRHILAGARIGVAEATK